jgi:hypothetical protein
VNWKEQLKQHNKPVFPVEKDCFVVDSYDNRGVVCLVVESETNSHFVQWFGQDKTYGMWADPKHLTLDLDNDMGFIQALRWLAREVPPTFFDEETTAKLRNLWELWLQGKLIEKDRGFLAQCAIGFVSQRGV